MKIKLFCSLIILALSAASAAFSEETVEKVVIFGAGPAGLTSAIYTAQAHLSPLVVEGNECEGQLASIYRMENFPGFPEGIRGDELIERMRTQAGKFGARFQKGIVANVDIKQRPFCITFDDGRTIFSEAIIVAIGTSKKWLGLDSENALKGKGVCGSATCEAELFQDKEVVVVGGGDSALEEALTLCTYASKVTVVYKANKLFASPYLQERVYANDKIQVILESDVVEVLDMTQDMVTGLILRNNKTKETSMIPCSGLFVSIGRQPNTHLFKGQLDLSAAGNIAVQSPSTQTSVPGVFAAGDVSDPTYRKAITAAGMGCTAALDAIRYLKVK